MTCPACGAAVDPGSRFCSVCGHQLVGLADERRVLTVLFADIVGFTTLAETLDPEKVKNLVDRWFERLVEDIAEFGGRVDKIIGDAIVALFGAPVAHEDDAERAVRAALRMQQTLAANAAQERVPAGGSGAEPASAVVRMRIGVNTGEVLVGALRAGGSTTAMGDVVNTASRLQTSARPGEVLVGATTHAATREQILYEPRGLLTARGRDARVEAWAAVEPLLPPGYRPPRRKAPLVGRDAELGLLNNAVSSSITNSRALLTLLVGDAGVGKTRLAAEVAERAACQHSALTFEGRCVPYGEANVWWPVAEALRQACFLELTTPVGEARSRIRERVGQALATDADTPEAERVTNGLLYLMGHEGPLRDIDPSSAREEAVRAISVFVEASTTHQPVVIQLSDLHWADDVVLELLDTLLERLARRPFVLLATARQVIRERWAARPGRHNALVVNLDPLESEAAGELLASLLGGAEPPADLRAALLERSGGNPFFLEELVALLGGQVPTSAAWSSPSPDGLRPLPDTLRGLVAARLDGLDADTRVVLTDAAIIGPRGKVEHLRRMAEAIGRDVDVDAAVAELVAKELFEFNDGQWAFRSDLVREVAYGTLTKVARARGHVGIATYMEAHQQGEWSDGAVDRLAHHYGVAAELVEELGSTERVPPDVRERAIHWIAEAASRAKRGEVLPAANRLYSRALELVGEERSSRRLGFLLGRSHVRAEAWDLEGARADAQAALLAATEQGDDTCAARALLNLGDVAQKAGDAELAVDTLEQAAQRFADLGDEQGRAEALRLQGMTEMFRGRFNEAERSVGAALEAFGRVGSRGGQAWALQNLAWIAFTTGRTEEADARLQQSVATFSEIGDAVGTAWAHGLLAFVRFQQGRREEAEQLASSGIVEARARGDRWATGMMLVLLSSLALWDGRTAEAVDLSAEAGAIFHEIGDGYGQTQALAPHARGLMMAGRVQEGFTAFEEALEAARSMPAHDAAGLVRGAYGGACVQLGDADRALEWGLLDDHEPEHTPTLADADEMVTLGLARLQRGRVDDAVSTLERAATGRDAAGTVHQDLAERPFAVSALALATAADGRSREAVTMAGRVSRLPAATYLDVLTAEVAAGLAEARAGDTTAARRWLASARDRADATGDQLAQSVVRLAEAVALDALGDPGAARAESAAAARLQRLGIAAGGWRCAFGLAAGAGRPA